MGVVARLSGLLAPAEAAAAAPAAAAPPPAAPTATEPPAAPRGWAYDVAASFGFVPGASVPTPAAQSAPAATAPAPMDPAAAAEARERELEELYNRAMAAEKKFKLAERRRAAASSAFPAEAAGASASGGGDVSGIMHLALSNLRAELLRAEAEAEAAWDKYFHAASAGGGDRDTRRSKGSLGRGRGSRGTGGPADAPRKGE